VPHSTYTNFTTLVVLKEYAPTFSTTTSPSRGVLGFGEGLVVGAEAALDDEVINVGRS